MKQKVIVLQIRFSGDDDTIYVCKTFEIAHRIIREWFKDSIEDINTYGIDDLEDELWERDIGYWVVEEEVVICE